MRSDQIKRLLKERAYIQERVTLNWLQRYGGIINCIYFSAHIDLLFHILLIPMYGVTIAFKEFKPHLGILGSPWAGFEHFERFFRSDQFWSLIQNTLGLSIYQLAAGFPLPIILAIEDWFRSVYVWSGVWQNAGWGAIIYLAALAGIDPGLHEAVIVDGASKPLFRQQTNTVVRNDFSISKNNEFPEASMRWADVVAEPDWTIQAMYGSYGAYLGKQADNKN